MASELINLSWNALILGDQSMVRLFEEHTNPELANVIGDKAVKFYSAEDGVIKNIPYDAIFLVIDLASLKTAGNPLSEVRNAQKRAVEHFGEVVHRHIILIAGYKGNAPVSDEKLDDYIDTYTKDNRIARNLFRLHKTRLTLCFDAPIPTERLEKLRDRVHEVVVENCGPIKHRIVLLGGTESYKESIGNLLLNEQVFRPLDPDVCISEERIVAGERIMVVNTPSVKPHMDVEDSDSPNQRKISECLLLTSPGPRVFIMVIDETENRIDIECCFQFFEKRFGTSSYNQLIVVLKKMRNNNYVPEPLCSYQKKLGGKIIFDYEDNTTEKRNNTRNEILSMIKNAETSKKELSLLLIGPSKIGKSSTAGSLLGLSQTDNIFSTDSQVRRSTISVAMRPFDSYDLVIIDTPGLGTEVISNDDVLKEIERCAYFPDGRPRPIAIVLRCDQTLYQHELDCFETIREKFESSMSQAMVIFTRLHYMQMHNKADGTQMDFRTYLHNIKSSNGLALGRLKTLLSSLQWRCVALENNADYKTKQQMAHTVYSLIDKVSTNNHVLRMVLVGPTGCGKSSCGNTIMSRQVFNASFSQLSNTEKTRVEEFEAEGRRIRLVDTPGLFDKRPQYTNKMITEEIVKCFEHTHPGPHVFLFTIDVQSRFSKDAQGTVDILKEVLGKDIFRNMVVIFSRRDALELDNKTVEQYIDEIGRQSSDVATQFLNKHGKCVAFDNRPGHQTGDEVKELLEAIDWTLAANEHRDFPCPIQAETQERIDEHFAGSRVNETALIKIGGVVGGAALMTKVLGLTIVGGLCFAVGACCAMKYRNEIKEMIEEHIGAIRVMTHTRQTRIAPIRVVTHTRRTRVNRT